MTVTLRNDFLPEGLNWSDEPLIAQGVVVHSTATPGASAADEDKYFHGGDRQASAHIFVDSHIAIKIVPLAAIAWHAGYTANRKFWGIEICETADHDEFLGDIQDALDVLEQMFRATEWPVRYQETPTLGQTLYSHAQTSALWHETNHQDPIAYFASHGYSMTMLAQALSDRLRTPGGS